MAEESNTSGKVGGTPDSDEISQRLEDIRLLLDDIPGLSDPEGDVRPVAPLCVSAKVVRRENGDVLVVIDRRGGGGISVYNYYYYGGAYPPYYSDYPFLQYSGEGTAVPNPEHRSNGGRFKGPRYVIVLLRIDGSIEMYTRNIAPTADGELA